MITTSILPYIWFAVMVVCIVIEALSSSLTTIWFALSALVLVFVSFLPVHLMYQLMIFVLLSALNLIFTRPFLKKFIQIKKTPTNSDAIIGKTAVVTEVITALQKGAVKVGGKIWTAKTVCDCTFEPGSTCVVSDIEGVSVIVTKGETSETGK